MRTREASHAGSWYSDHKSTLSKQLDEWLDQVPDAIEGVGSIPPSGARAIIAPYVSAIVHLQTPQNANHLSCRHAGYAYSGPAAAWAYKCLDFSKAYDPILP